MRRLIFFVNFFHHVITFLKIYRKNGVYGKFLRRQNVVVLMENKHCQAELEGMVRDCGATSLKWDCKDLSMKKDEELERINVIYTDMSDTIMYDLDFLRFMNRNRVSF